MKTKGKGVGLLHGYSVGDNSNSAVLIIIAGLDHVLDLESNDRSVEEDKIRDFDNGLTIQLLNAGRKKKEWKKQDIWWKCLVFSSG
jgi:hypothetical protein